MLLFAYISIISTGFSKFWLFFTKLESFKDYCSINEMKWNMCSITQNIILNNIIHKKYIKNQIVGYEHKLL